MSGEHIWVNSDLFLTSVRSGVMSLEAPKNQGFLEMWFFKEENAFKKSPRQSKMMYTPYVGGKTLLSML